MRLSGTQKRIRGPPFPYKRTGQPTSAGRCISSEYVDYGWSVPLTRAQNQTAENSTAQSKAMYALQVRRNRPVDSFSMRSAIFWEHRKLPDQRIVSTPSTDIFGFFAKDEEVASQSIRDIRRKYSEDDQSIEMHLLFEAVREREFMVWAADFDGVWVLLILRFEDIGTHEELGEPASSFADRKVAEMVIVDTLAEGREDRRRIIGERFPLVMIHGCIAVKEDIQVHDINPPNVSHAWQTGYTTYAIAREFLRRLGILTWRRQVLNDYNHDFVWDRFEGYYNIDAYRQHMMSACAHHCIEEADYGVRMALEVPSDGSGYYPSDLSHLHAPSVTEPPEQVPDEIFSYFTPRGETQRTVILNLAGTPRRESHQSDPQHHLSEGENEGQYEDSDADAPDDGIPDEEVLAPIREDKQLPPGTLNTQHPLREPDQPSTGYDKPRNPNDSPTLPYLRVQKALGPSKTGDIAMSGVTTYAYGPIILPLLETPGDTEEQYVKGKMVITISESDSSSDGGYTAPAVPIAPMEPTGFANPHAGTPGLGSLSNAQPNASTGTTAPMTSFQGAQGGHAGHGSLSTSFPGYQEHLSQFSISGSHGGSGSGGGGETWGIGSDSGRGSGHGSNKRGPSGGGRSVLKRPRYDDYL